MGDNDERTTFSDKVKDDGSRDYYFARDGQTFTAKKDRSRERTHGHVVEEVDPISGERSYPYARDDGEFRIDGHANAAHGREQAAAGRKRDLIRQAEHIAAQVDDRPESTTDWKRHGDDLADLLARWKEAGRVGALDQTLWDEFATARQRFHDSRKACFAAHDAQRAAATRRKERLIREAGSLADRSDWKAANADAARLLAEWKSTPRANRDQE